jgi:hypothetical protein
MSKRIATMEGESIRKEIPQLGSGDLRIQDGDDL